MTADDLQPAALVPADPSAAELETLTGRAQAYAAAAKSPATWRAYHTDWRHFQTWCHTHGLQALPADPATVALYLTAHADTLRPSTLDRRLSAISQYHQAHGHDTPTKTTPVRLARKGIRRQVGAAPRKAAPILTELLRRMLAHLPGGLLGVRDRALLLLGYAGALRRSELAALTVDDMDDTPEGLIIRIRSSKTDQEGQGELVGIKPARHDPDLCPVMAWQAWLERSGITSGPAFRPIDRRGQVGARTLSDRGVDRRVRRYATLAGLPEGSFSAHSLRGGFATQAARNGAGERQIMRHGRWKSLTVARGYINEGTVFTDSPVDYLGL